MLRAGLDTGLVSSVTEHPGLSIQCFFTTRGGLASPPTCACPSTPPQPVQLTRTGIARKYHEWYLDNR